VPMKARRFSRPLQ